MTFAYGAMKDEFRRIARGNVSHPFWWYPEDCAWIARLVCEGMSLRRQAMPAHRLGGSFTGDGVQD